MEYENDDVNMQEQPPIQVEREAFQALHMAQELIGYIPAVKCAESLPHNALALLRPPITPTDAYEIYFASGQEFALGYLITHEVGHLLRLHQVTEDERLYPLATSKTSLDLLHQLKEELFSLAKAGLPIFKLFDRWHESVCVQLANYPADFRIESWIHKQFPRFETTQRLVLFEDVQEPTRLFRHEVVRLTPPTIYQANMAMYSARAYYVADLYGMPELTEQFDQHGFGDIGKELARQVLETDRQSEDEGHRSDMITINRWAEMLGLTGWFEWQR